MESLHVRQTHCKFVIVRNLLQAKFGHWERSESVLQSLRGKNADVSEEATEIRVHIVFVY